MPLTWNETANKWEGDDTAAVPDLAFNLYSALPDPTTVEAGTRAVVLGDTDLLNGLHLAIGPVGGMAHYWRGA